DRTPCHTADIHAAAFAIGSHFAAHIAAHSLTLAYSTSLGVRCLYGPVSSAQAVASLHRSNRWGRLVVSFLLHSLLFQHSTSYYLSFCTHSKYHGQGIGRELLRRALEIRHGATQFCLHASMHPNAQMLYLKAGLFPRPHSTWLQLESEDVQKLDIPHPVDMV